MKLCYYLIQMRFCFRIIFLGEFSDLIYFSFVTITTLGYGDITPVSRMAKNLAVLEAVWGQTYLAVLVARLVGLHLSSSGRFD